MRNWFFSVLMLFALSIVSGCATTGSGPVEVAQPAVSALNADETKLFDEAMRLINDENYDDGIALLEQLTAKSRTSAIPFINLAIAQKKIDDFENAEKNLKTALEIEPDNPVANNEYGLLLRRVGRFQESRAIYEKILTKFPNFALANKNLGVLCDIYIRDYSCALNAYKAYSAAVPDDDKAQIWISDLEYRVKQ